MSDPYEPPRPRDDGIESELESLHQQEEEGHATPEEQRRAEQLEHRLQVDEHGEEVGNAGRRTASWIARIPKRAIVSATDGSRDLVISLVLPRPRPAG